MMAYRPRAVKPPVSRPLPALPAHARLAPRTRPEPRPSRVREGERPMTKKYIVPFGIESRDLGERCRRLCSWSARRPRLRRAPRSRPPRPGPPPKSRRLEVAPDRAPRPRRAGGQADRPPHRRHARRRSRPRPPLKAFVDGAAHRASDARRSPSRPREEQLRRPPPRARPSRSRRGSRSAGPRPAPPSRSAARSRWPRRAVGASISSIIPTPTSATPSSSRAWPAITSNISIP